ncbi:hypothetical protein B0T13DRAFT_188240 [Neurospora crassa]|nr:hypothetical protein B0T13DRAFT_188240 [Neurospora crassa]
MRASLRLQVPVTRSAPARPQAHVHKTEYGTGLGKEMCGRTAGTAYITTRDALWFPSLQKAQLLLFFLQSCPTVVCCPAGPSIGNPRPGRLRFVGFLHCGCSTKQCHPSLPSAPSRPVPVPVSPPRLRISFLFFFFFSFFSCFFLSQGSLPNSVCSPLDVVFVVSYLVTCRIGWHLARTHALHQTVRQSVSGK